MKTDPLITKYFSNQLSKEEADEFRSRITNDAGFKQDVDAYQNIWDHVSETSVETNTDAAWETISGELGFTEKKPKQYTYYYISAAACFLIFVINSFYFSSSMATYQTNSSGEHTLTLIDGSVVKLNKNSQLTYFTQLNDSVRKIEITGEAFFKVAKNGKPFIVETKHATIRVLGTEFNVRELPTKTELIVEEGKVSFTNKLKKDKSIILTAGKISSCSSNAYPEAIQTISTFYAWYKDALMFDNVSLDNVLRALEEKYSIRIKRDIAEISSIQVTARFSKEQSLTTVLEAISQMYQIRIIKESESRYTLYKQEMRI